MPGSVLREWTLLICFSNDGGCEKDARGEIPLLIGGLSTTVLARFSLLVGDGLGLESRIEATASADTERW